MGIIGSTIIWLALISIVIGIVGLIKGSIKLFKITTRKASLKLIGFAFIVMIIGGILLPNNTTEVISEEKNIIEENIEHVKEKVTENKDSNEQHEEAKETSSTSSEESSAVVVNEQTVPTTSSPVTKMGNLEVHFVDVGQGASQVIITPNKKVMVIDGGNNSEEDTMVNYLNSLGIKKIDILIGTHPDSDHIGGLDAVVDHFDIGQVIMPKVQRDTQTFESLLQSIANKGLKVTTAKSGIQMSLDDNVLLKMISPVVDSHSDANEMSAVIKLTYGKHSFLLTGDAGVEMEQKWITNGVDLSSTVLLVGHHGSEHSTSESFIQKVKPTYAVIQVGKNSYGHPTTTILDRLQKSNINIYRNDTDGTIIFKTDGSTMTVNKNAWKNPNTAVKPIGKTPVATTPSVVVTPPAATSNKTQSIMATATISNNNPTSNASVTVQVKVTDSNNQPVSGANVKLTLAFKSKDTIYESTTDSNGNASLEFKIGRAASGFTVIGDINVQYNGLTTKTTTAFTPL